MEFLNKLKGFRRIGVAIFVSLGVLAPAIGVNFTPEDAQEIATNWDELITAGSGFMAVALALWSKFWPDDK